MELHVNREVGAYMGLGVVVGRGHSYFHIMDKVEEGNVQKKALCKRIKRIEVNIRRRPLTIDLQSDIQRGEHR